MIFWLILSVDMKSVWHRVYSMYAEGFRSMTVGRSLWIVIAIKLAVMFLVIKLFFMPDAMSDCTTDAERAQAVRTSLTTPKTIQ